MYLDNKWFMLSDPVIALVWAAGVVAFRVTGRLIEMLSIDPDAAPEQILKNVRRSVDVFVEKTEQFDDLTMLCLEYRSAKSVAEENRP